MRCLKEKGEAIQKRHRATTSLGYYDENSPAVTVSSGLLGVRCSVKNPAQFQDGARAGNRCESLGPERHPSAHTKGLFGSCSPMHHGARPRGPATRDCLKN